MTLPHRAAGALLLAGALVASGCGTKCPTEAPAQIQKIGSCTAKPGDTVSVPIRLCPTCNQTGATCAVDTSQAGFVHLDPTVEACDNASSCGSGAPTCEANPLVCTFTVPSNASGTITLVAFDPYTNQEIDSVLTISSSVTPSCENI